MRVALEEAERAPDRSIEAKRRHLKGGRGGGRGGGGGNDRDTERTKGGSWSKEAKEGREREKGHSRELRAIHVTLKYFGKFMPNKN